MHRRTFIEGLGGAVGVASGLDADTADLATTSTQEEVEILRDEYGEPHVYADSVYALGYGNGYVQAGDLELGTYVRNPSRGYVVNWNNGPAKEWRAGDVEQNWGSIHRVDQLDRLLREQAGLDAEGRRPPESATDPLDADDVAEVVTRAALHDASAYVEAAFFADVAENADDPQVREMGEYLRQWADADADWYDDDGEVPYTDGEDDRYDQSGHAIYVAVRDHLHREVFAVLARTGEEGPEIDWEPEPSRHAAPHGTVWDDVTFVDALRGDTDHDWFDGRRDELIREALEAAAGDLEERFAGDEFDDVSDPSDPGEWLEPTHKSRFLPLGAIRQEAIDVHNRASYNQALDAAGWTAGEASTWREAAGDVMPPANDGVITVEELPGAQATGEEPDRLTNQLDLYVNNEYKPHPATREQVEQEAVEELTLQAVQRSPDGAVAPSEDVSAGLFEVDGGDDGESPGLDGTTDTE